MNTILLSLSQVGSTNHSLWENVVAAFPRDAASLVTLGLLLGAFIFVVVAGVSSNGKGKGRGGLSA